MSPPGHRAVWRIAAPLILSNSTVALLGVVDTAVVGHLASPHYLGAVAVGATVFNFLYMGLNFLRMGTTGITAQALGTGASGELRVVLGQAGLTAIALAAVLLTAQAPLAALAFLLIAPEAEVLAEAQRYFDVRIWSAPAALANLAVVGWFIGMQSGRAPLAILLLVNLLNIALDLLFVLVLGRGADGVAAASVVAEYAGLALGLALVRRRLRRHPGRWRRDHLFDRRRFRRLLSVNANLLVRTMTLMFAFGFLTAQGARLGELVLAANAVLLNFQYLTAFALDGFANAAEALVGRALGAGDRAGLAQAVRSSLAWAVAVALAFSAVYLFFGDSLIALITDLPQVRETAARYLPWLILSPLVSVWSFLYDGLYVGATLARQMRNTMLVSAFVVYLPAWYLLQPFGNHGLWAAFLAFMTARGLTMAWVWRRVGPELQPPA